MGEISARLSFPEREPAGLTLIEIIITTTLLGMILLFLFTIYPNAVMAIRSGEHRLKAANIAQSMLEKKMAVPFYDIDTPLTEKNMTGEDGTAYALSYETLPIPDTNTQRIRKIRVTVTWEEHNSRQCSIFKEYDVCDIRH